MEDSQLKEMEVLALAATPGPWRWEFHPNSKAISLCGGKPTYDLTVMDFVRYGMGSAAPRFRDMRHPTLQVMTRADEFGVVIPGREHHADWFKGIEHPDAAFIAAARTFIPEAIAEIRRLSAPTIGEVNKAEPFSIQEAAWNAAGEVRAGILTNDGAHAAQMLDWLMTNLYHPSFRQRPDLTPEEHRLLGEALGLPTTRPTPSPVKIDQPLVVCDGEADWTSEEKWSMLLFPDGATQLGMWRVDDEASEKADEMLGGWMWYDEDDCWNIFSPQPTHFMPEKGGHGTSTTPATQDTKKGGVAGE